MTQWNEFECPYCRRIGQVNPDRGYKSGEIISMECPYCGDKLMVLCAYEPTFYAYRLENERLNEND